MHDRLRTDLWTTRGPVKVRHDVEVGRAELRGTTTVGGTYSSSRTRVDGTLEVVGRIDSSGALVVVGELRAAAELRCRSLEVHGALAAARHVTVDEALVARGAVRLPSADAGTSELEGPVDLPGRLRSETASLALGDGSHVGFVEARWVRASGPLPNPVEAMLGRHGTAAIDRVEAARAELTGVTVAFVRAPEIVLGPRAVVTAVEGTIVARHRSAHVGPVSRTAPPAGLVR